MTHAIPAPNRRALLGLSVSVATGALTWALLGDAAAAAPSHLTLSDAAWRKRLTPDAYAVLRQAATEAPYTSPLNDEHRRGTFACAGCALPLYASATKFNSGTGWPSFYDHLPAAITERRDLSLGIARTEVRCARCDGHLGHVFDDGPRPTGKRYCMNGVALRFRAA